MYRDSRWRRFLVDLFEGHDVVRRRGSGFQVDVLAGSGIEGLERFQKSRGTGIRLILARFQGAKK